MELLPVSAECNCDCMFAHATKYSGQITRHRTEDSMNRCRASFSWLKANHMQHINPLWLPQPWGRRKNWGTPPDPQSFSRKEGFAPLHSLFARQSSPVQRMTNGDLIGILEWLMIESESMAKQGWNFGEGFPPKTVAIVGVSRSDSTPHPGYTGVGLLRILLKAGFQGRVYQLNRHLSFVVQD